MPRKDFRQYTDCPGVNMLPILVDSAPLRCNARIMVPRLHRNYRFLLAVFCVVSGSFGGLSFAQAQYQLYGLDFSPLLHGQAPGTQIGTAQIQARLAIVAPYTKWVRTYSNLNGLDQVCPIAHQMGLKCAAGASIYGSSTDTQEIASLTTLAQNGYADLAIVGTEALFRGNVSAATLVNYINQVKSAAPGVQVTTADTYGVWFDNPSVLAAADVVLVNIYPFYEQVSLDHAVAWVNGWYQLLTQAAGSKQVWMSETGWPTGGSAIGVAVPSPVNGSSYFLNFVSWARANNVPYFYFEALDEAWKSSENSQGPYFGIWDENGNLKPGMGAVFSGKTMPDNWSGDSVPGGSGTPSVVLTYVPPFGSSNQLSGQVLHVRPADYKIGCFIYVSPSWYVKPFASRPLTPIFADGTWTCAPASTGDTAETKIGAFVFPNGYNPPWQVGGDPPSVLLQNSIANAIVTRTQSAIAGLVQDNLGNGIDGVTVSLSGSQVETTQTAQGGKYSFIDLTPGGNYVVTPSNTNATFTPANLSFPSLSGVQTGNFTATSHLLSISGQVSDTGGNALNHVPLSLNGTVSGSGLTDVFGNYRFSGLFPGGSYTITPSTRSYGFNPPSQMFTNLTSSQTGNFTASPLALGPVAALRDNVGSVRLSAYASSTLSNSGGLFASDPSAAQDLSGNTFVTARDNFNSIWANVYNPNTATWLGWRFGGGIIQGVPSLAVDTNGTAWIASRDNYNSYWLVNYTRGSFGSWTPLLGIFSTDPAVAACADGSIYLIGKDNFNSLWSGHYIPGTGFLGWQFGGGVIKGKPAITCGNDSAVYIVARDFFNSNWMARVVGNAWTGWFYGGAINSADPKIAALADGTIGVLILDPTNVVWRTAFTEGTGNGWEPWLQVGGVLLDVAGAGGGGQLYFVGKAPNGDLWWWRQTGSQWTWIGNNGVAAGALSAAPR